LETAVGAVSCKSIARAKDPFVCDQQPNQNPKRATTPEPFMSISSKKRFAIITPYHKEARPLVRRCIDSVKNQSIPTDHFLIADGFPQLWIDGERVRHFKLDREHGDNGNTPRGIGALIAIGEEYDGIGMLDADNWLDNDHVEACLEAAASSEGGATQCDYVIAQRRFRRPDETILPFPEETGFVDTSCFFFLRGAFNIVPYWATMPRALSPICDRVFGAMLRRHTFQYACVKKTTVNFHCLWESCYRTLGENPPPEAKHFLDESNLERWLSSLSPRELEIACRLSGVLRLHSGKYLGLTF
jgi:glycosyltransferase involved in cell wall biosynthesis